MKFKTIIAAAMTLALTAGTLKMADIKPGTTAFADTAAKKTYNIDGYMNGPGAIWAKDYASEGDAVSLTLVTNKEGYVIGRFVLKCGATTLIDDSPYVKQKTYPFTMPAGDVTYHVIFEQDPNYVPDPEPTPEPTPAPEPTPDPDPTPTPEPEYVPIQIPNPVNYKGDVNGDGRINAKDATLILKHTVQLITLDTEQLDRADVNGDGRVNTSDATLILKIAVGLIHPPITN